jgi:hypothetical protein
MNVEQIKGVLEAKVLSGEKFLDRDIQMAGAADLMSDVLSFTKFNNILLLTGLINPQAIYTADAVNIKVICFVRGKQPGTEVIDLAKERGMTLLCTKFFMYESCGRLFNAGLRGFPKNEV